MFPPAPPRPGPDRRPFALLVLGVAAFTVYGSLVPFTFRPLPPGEAVGVFARAMADRARVDSRSDAVANVLLGVPLGFGLLGFFRVGTSNRAADWPVAVALLPGCVLFAAAVEFAQLYVPSRMCAGSDVLCQGFGSAVGMVGWVLAGRWLTRQAEAVWHGGQLGGAAGRLLVVYLALLAFVQLLPMDLSASPRDLYHKLRDGVVYVPFSEFLEPKTNLWERAARLVQVFGLYLPVGLLAAGLPGQFWRPGNAPRVLAVAFGLAAVLEGMQLVVQSRVTSATDLVVGGSAALVGWLLPRVGMGQFAALGLGAAWLVALAFVSWEPFTIRPDGAALPFDWIPGLPLENGNPLFALEEMITKLVLFSLVGVVVASVGPARRAGLTCAARRAAPTGAPGRVFAVGCFTAAVVGLTASAVFEAGQTVIGSHTPCITDVLLGGAGAVAGAWAAGRVRAGVY